MRDLIWTAVGNLGRRLLERSQSQLYRPCPIVDELEKHMAEELRVGDRVVYRGWQSRGSPDRFGVVAEMYRGAPSANDKGVALVAVKWDDTGCIERGYIQQSGSLVRTLEVLRPEKGAAKK